MDIRNTTLDDLSAVIGFSATLRLAAWFGDGTSNLYVPAEVEEGQLLVKLLGMANAQRLSAEWGMQHLAIPRLRDYEDDVRKKIVGRMFEKGFGSREIAGHLRLSERRVQQICRELEQVGLIAPQGPAKTPPEKPPRKGQGGLLGKNATGLPDALPAAFFALPDGVAR